MTETTDNSTEKKATKAELKAKDALRQEFAPGSTGEASGVLFTPEEMDIYVNKITLEAYIFHGKDVNYDSLDRLEYHPGTFKVDVIHKDGTKMELGVEIQWLVRPYFSKAQEINIVQTKNGKSVNGCIVPIVHKDK